MKKQNCKQHHEFAACFWKILYTNSLEWGSVFCSWWLGCTSFEVGLKKWKLLSSLFSSIEKLHNLPMTLFKVEKCGDRPFAMDCCTWCKAGVTSSGVKVWEAELNLLALALLIWLHSRHHFLFVNRRHCFQKCQPVQLIGAVKSVTSWLSCFSFLVSRSILFWCESATSCKLVTACTMVLRF